MGVNDFINRLTLHDGRDAAKVEDDWVPVQYREEIPLGCRVKTVKVPTTTQGYGNMHFYVNKEATTVSYLPGIELVKLRFGDGALHNWGYRDVLIRPQDRKPLQTKRGRNRINPAVDGPGYPETRLLTITDEDRRPKKTVEEAQIHPATDAVGGMWVGEDLAADSNEKLKEAIDTEGWIEADDPSTHRKYWYHPDTRERTWDIAKRLGIEEEPDEPVPVPEVLTVSVAFPTMDEPPFDPQGTYAKAADVNGHPAWTNFKKKTYLFSTTWGHWAVGDSKSQFAMPKHELENQPNILISARPHNGRMPVEAGLQWVIGSDVYCEVEVVQSAAEAAMFLFDVFYERYAPENAGKAAKLVEAIANGTHTLRAVVEQLCAHYHVEDSNWTGNPPKELVRHRVAEYTRKHNLSSASWLQVDAVVARATTPANLDREMVAICRRSGGKASEWVGAYPAALREPVPSKDTIRFCLSCMMAQAGVPHEEERVTDALTRVLQNGERWMAVLTHNANELGVDYAAWREGTPRPVVDLTVAKFFATYDPHGRGEVEPITNAVGQGKYTLDDVMRQLCMQWRDKGADEADWVGDYPLAMQPGYVTVATPGSTYPSVPSIDQRSASKGQISMRTAILGNKFRLFGFENMHKAELGRVDAVPPTGHIQRAVRHSRTPEELTAYVDKILLTYLKQCNIEPEHHYLWLGDEPPALVRFRYDTMLGARKDQCEEARDEVIQEVALGSSTVDDGVRDLAPLNSVDPEEWVGPFPKALLGAFELTGNDGSSDIFNEGEEGFPGAPPRPKPPPGSGSLLEYEDGLSISTGSTSLYEPGQRFTLHSTSTPSASDIVSPNGLLRTPPIMTTPNEQYLGPARKVLSLSERIERADKEGVLAKHSVRFNTLTPSVGKGFFDSAVFRLNVFHEVAGLGFGGVPELVKMVTHGTNPQLQLDNVMMQLCVANNIIDVEGWCGATPRAVYTYRIDAFFDTHDPPSGYQTPHLVDLALHPSCSIDIILREICKAYRLNPTPYLSDFPDFFKEKIRQSPYSAPPGPITPIEPSYNVLDHLKAEMGLSLPFHML
eukprot:TRINITY_DN4866_c0_g1_i1.p1 TRINITY_DN4866_c0_g1~~TRINITY_DN4866_c0_g1_i1.p1  ORF type:complete len:1092 (+),score=187.53 TRINITY_DN4866_c0_g1_i1:92-3277(+)